VTPHSRVNILVSQDQREGGRKDAEGARKEDPRIKALLCREGDKERHFRRARRTISVAYPAPIGEEGVLREKSPQLSLSREKRAYNEKGMALGFAAIRIEGENAHRTREGRRSALLQEKARNGLAS